MVRLFGYPLRNFSHIFIHQIRDGRNSFFGVGFYRQFAGGRGRADHYFPRDFMGHGFAARETLGNFITLRNAFGVYVFQRVGDNRGAVRPLGDPFHPHPHLG